MAKQDKNMLQVVKTAAPINPEQLPSGMYWAPTTRPESNRARNRRLVLARYGNIKRELSQTLSAVALNSRQLVTAPKRKKRSQSPAASLKKAA